MTAKQRFDEFYTSWKRWYLVKKPKDLARSAMKLGEETGEVFEGLTAYMGSRSKRRKLMKKGQTPRNSIIEELGDVLRVVMNLATLCKIPIDELFHAASQKNEEKIAEALREFEDVRSGKRS